eukprot:scaffold3292_cov43-Attheya_sp.AAC.3
MTLSIGGRDASQNVPALHFFSPSSPTQRLSSPHSHIMKSSFPIASTVQDMSTSVLNMYNGTIPRFSSASAAKKGQAGQNAKDESEDTLDFDLLAEYLLDDGMMVPGSNGFDFGIDFPTASSTPGVVSPDHEASNADPLADAATLIGNNGENRGDLVGDLAHVQQMIAAHAAAAQQKINVSPATQAPIAPSMPGTTAIAPAPTSRGGMPMTVPRMNTSAPASLAPAIQGVPVATHHMHHASMPATKRKRADTAATSNKTINMNMHGFPQGIPPRNGRQKSQAQIDRRRERNRILARRTRLRKKFFFESLQKDVSDLQKENVALKEVVRTKLEPAKAKELLDNCDAMEKLPSDIAETFGIGELDRRDFSLIHSIQKSQQCFVITDPSLQDNPIVYASDDFLSVTGYSREDVLGRNCRFLQGTETSADKVESIRKAISQGEDISVCFINYTADGTAFWNKLFIAALRDAQNNIVNFIGVTVKVAGPEPGDPEAGKLLPGEAEAEYDSGSEIGSGPMSGINDADAMAKAAEGTVMAIEGVVSAAFAGAPGLRS